MHYNLDGMKQEGGRPEQSSSGFSALASRSNLENLCAKEKIPTLVSSMFNRKFFCFS
jgi:hypothetical protein